MACQGVETIMTQILPIFKVKKWSEESTKNMMLRYGTDENSARLGMAILEIAAVADYRKIFAESCYTLEGNSAIILRASSVFERLESTIGIQPPLLQVHNIVEKSLELIVNSRDILSCKKRRI